MHMQMESTMTEKLVDILGVSFTNTTRQQLVERINHHVLQEERTFIVTANPEIVIKANEDENYMKDIKKANYITADGIGIVKAAQLLDRPLPERVAGYEVMLDLLKLADQNSYKVYFLGAAEETLQKMMQNVKRDYPNIEIVGSQHGFFDWSDGQIPERIVAAEPDFVFVALGAPRQEKWISQHIHLFNKGIFMGIGGSFDVIAGTVKRAPVLWQKLNLEWLYRIVKQPSRIKRSVAIPQFILQILKEKIKGIAK